MTDKKAGSEVSSADLQSLAVIAHVTYANDSANSELVSAENIAQLGRRLSNGIGKNIEVDRMSSIGFYFLGGDLVHESEGVSALTIYENRQNVKLSLFVRNAQYKDASKLSDSGKPERYNWLSWQSNGSQFVLVSELDQTELQKALNNMK